MHVFIKYLFIGDTVVQWELLPSNKKACVNVFVLSVCPCDWPVQGAPGLSHVNRRPSVTQKEKEWVKETNEFKHISFKMQIYSSLIPLKKKRKDQFQIHS